MNPLGVLMSCALVVGAARPLPGNFEQVLLLVRSGDFTSAAELARELEAPLERAQALVYLEHHAGNLERALATARAGAERFPEDSFLADQRAYIALSLRRSAESTLALEALTRLALDPRQPLERRERDAAKLAEYKTECSALVHSEAQATAARVTARWLVLGGLVLCVALIAWSLRPTSQRV